MADSQGDQGKRSTTGGDNDSSDDDDYGPAPVPQEATTGDVAQPLQQKKKRRRLAHEEVYVSHLPCADMYEKSYMHRDWVSHCVFTPKSDFLVTASQDGHVKFWKKMPEGLEFVKHYHAHLGAVNSLAASPDGLRLCTTGRDRAIKLYDVLSFDLSDMIEVAYTPTIALWIHKGGSEPYGRVAVADADSSTIRIYRADGSREPVHTLPSLHTAPVMSMAFNLESGVVVSGDRNGILEYWSSEDYNFPGRQVAWKSKMDTDLYELVKRKTQPLSIDISRDGSKMAIMGKDKQIRVLSFAKAKLLRVYNESMEVFEAAMATGSLGIDSIDFGRRSAVENELESSPSAVHQNAIFDETGHFLMYGTLVGIKIVNVETNRVVKVLGRLESSERFLQVTLFQGVPKVDSQLIKALNKGKAASSVEEMRAQLQPDPTIVCTAFKKRRFYLFSRRMPDDVSADIGGRDVFNERPTAEETKVVHEVDHVLGRQAIIRTTLGDIHIKLFREECPKTVENFTTHARNGYYDNVIFHRVIKGFMLQTGDPLGDGTGGESIWGGEFQDEFHRNLRHDRPFTVSMANAGPNTNGSQFFITTVPTPWLDNKHTIFGRVTQGMDVVQTIENVKTDHLDKPFQPPSIINIDIL